MKFLDRLLSLCPANEEPIIPFYNQLDARIPGGKRQRIVNVSKIDAIGALTSKVRFLDMRFKNPKRGECLVSAHLTRAAPPHHIQTHPQHPAF